MYGGTSLDEFKVKCAMALDGVSHSAEGITLILEHEQCSKKKLTHPKIEELEHVLEGDVLTVVINNLAENASMVEVAEDPLEACDSESSVVAPLDDSPLDSLNGLAQEQNVAGWRIVETFVSTHKDHGTLERLQRFDESNVCVEGGDAEIWRCKECAEVLGCSLEECRRPGECKSAFVAGQDWYIKFRNKTPTRFFGCPSMVSIPTYINPANRRFRINQMYHNHLITKSSVHHFLTKAVDDVKRASAAAARPAQNEEVELRFDEEHFASLSRQNQELIREQTGQLNPVGTKGLRKGGIPPPKKGLHTLSYFTPPLSCRPRGV